MTGPEHYKMAERCLASVDEVSETAMAYFAEAQVHATLALAAATAISYGKPPGEYAAWCEAAATKDEVTR